MPQYEPVDQLALDLQDRWPDVRARSVVLLQSDAEFAGVEPPSQDFAMAMAVALRAPQSLASGIDPDWNEAAIAFAQECGSIGVFSCRLRYVAAATDDVLVSGFPPDMRAEPLARLFCATYLALEAVARHTAKAISRMAFHSETTSLRNKRGLELDVERIVERRLADIVHIAYIDMDGLKTINDTQGHAAGDEALRDIGAVLAKGIDQNQTAYHFSGDEFGVLQVGGDAAALVALLESALKSTRQKFSYGVAEWPVQSSGWASALELADTRMQAQKKQRRAEGKVPARGQ